MFDVFGNIFGKRKTQPDLNPRETQSRVEEDFVILGETTSERNSIHDSHPSSSADIPPPYPTMYPIYPGLESSTTARSEDKTSSVQSSPSSIEGVPFNLNTFFGRFSFEEEIKSVLQRLDHSKQLNSSLNYDFSLERSVIKESSDSDFCC